MTTTSASSPSSARDVAGALERAATAARSRARSSGSRRCAPRRCGRGRRTACAAGDGAIIVGAEDGVVMMRAILRAAAAARSPPARGSAEPHSARRPPRCSVERGARGVRRRPSRRVAAPRQHDPSSRRIAVSSVVAAQSRSPCVRANSSARSASSSGSVASAASDDVARDAARDERLRDRPTCPCPCGSSPACTQLLGEHRVVEPASAR